MINYQLKPNTMKKIFTLFLVFAGAFALLAQNPYVNAAKTGLAISFDTEADVLNDYVARRGYGRYLLGGRSLEN
jgi:hypothetical protein